MDLRRVCRPLAAGLFALLAFVASCGSERYIVVGTARAPSASGFITIKDSSANSTTVLVHMEQLHPVDSLDPSMHAYVVWFEAGKSAPLRAGSLKYRPDDRIGELEATAPSRNFIVKITAEANDKPSAESGFVIASEQVSAKD